jgi:hypothetical protein
MDELPEIVLLLIAGHLSAKDTLALCHTSRRLFMVVSNDKAIWTKHASQNAGFPARR